MEVSYPALNYWIYRTPEARRYSTFSITKKSGKERTIDAPNTNIKILQRKLNRVLQSVYSPKPSVHGFIVGRNVKSNAQQHIGKRWVFNVDLEDFFPSIHFGRVRGMFMGKPYCLPPGVATVLAHLCCFQRHLPQGAPTSPVVSNMICAQMDSQLQGLAKKCNATYTRYVDDITFSGKRWSLPVDIVVLSDNNQLFPGDELLRIIKDNDFRVNDRKIWLSRPHRRQAVTGVTVNEFPNLPRRFTNQIRAMLHAWRKHGLDAAQLEWIAKYGGRDRAPWRHHPSFAQVLKGKIGYLGMIRGQESRSYLKLLDELYELSPDLAGEEGTPLNLLKRTYEELKAGTVDPKTRGYWFENFMNNLFRAFEVPVIKGFKRKSGSEQIDGAFKLEGWYYLVECRWRKNKASRGEVDAFAMKLQRSGQQVTGAFIAINEWSKYVLSSLNQNSKNNVLLINGEDIEVVLNGEIALDFMIQRKNEALNVHSEPFISARDILAQQHSENLD